MPPVLGLEAEPVEVVRVEDVDEGTERQSVVPVSGEICHRDLKLSVILSQTSHLLPDNP